MLLQDLINILGERFIPAVEAQLLLLVHEKPDFVYKPLGVKGACQYNGPATFGYTVVGPECDGCIFGQAFQRLGWDKTEFLGGPIGQVMNVHKVHAPWSWTNVQQAQDRGQTWKSAVAMLDERILPHEDV